MKWFVIILTSLFLVACAGQNTITTRSAPDIEMFKPSLPRAVTPGEVDVRVLTPNNARSIVSEQPDGVMIGMNFNSYQNMVGTTQDLVRYIESSQAIIEYYENNLGSNEE